MHIYIKREEEKLNEHQWKFPRYKGPQCLGQKRCTTGIEIWSDILLIQKFLPFNFFKLLITR